MPWAVEGMQKVGGTRGVQEGSERIGGFRVQRTRQGVNTGNSRCTDITKILLFEANGLSRFKPRGKTSEAGGMGQLEGSRERATASGEQGSGSRERGAGFHGHRSRSGEVGWLQQIHPSLTGLFRSRQKSRDYVDDSHGTFMLRHSHRTLTRHINGSKQEGQDKKHLPYIMVRREGQAEMRQELVRMSDGNGGGGWGRKAEEVGRSPGGGERIVGREKGQGRAGQQ
eukprot:762497-Hanusia_phi.AAC.2